MKEEISQGAIYEIPLLKGYGYAYGKVVNYDVNINNILTQKTIIKIYNCFSKELGAINDFSKLDYKFTPLILLGKPKERGEHKWKLIGNEKLRDEDQQIPEFKSSFALVSVRNEGQINSLKWHVTMNFNAPNRRKADCYNEIKHLGAFVYMKQLSVIYKITFDWMLANGDDPLKYFEIDEINSLPGLPMVYALSKSEL